MFYPDPSVLVAIYVGEPHSDRSRTWLSERVAEIALSGWTEVEFASALALKERSGEISAEKRMVALADFQRQWSDNGETLPILPATFRRAAEMINQVVGLRAGDALHLAIAEGNRATLVTLDRQQARLGHEMGINAELL